MKIEFCLQEEDFVTWKLYEMVKSPKRFWSRIFIFILFFFSFIANVMLTTSYHNIVSVCIWGAWAVIGILVFIFFPKIDRKEITRMNINLVRKTYLEKFGKLTTIEFTDEFIFEQEGKNERKTDTQELQDINEIISHIFINIKGGESFILPKERISNINEVIFYLKDLSTRLNISYNRDINWKWK